MKNLFKIIGYSLPLILLDQVTKFYVVNGKLIGEIIPDYLSFTLRFNKGIALSLPLRGKTQIFLIFLVLILGIWYIRKHFNLNKTTNQFILASILGGAIGNLIDRFNHGAVVDFISIWKFPIFNLADVFIFYSMYILIYLELKGKSV